MEGLVLKWCTHPGTRYSPTSARPLCSISCTQWTTIAGTCGMHVGQKEAWSASCSEGVWLANGGGGGGGGGGVSNGKILPSKC